MTEALRAVWQQLKGDKDTIAALPTRDEALAFIREKTGIDATDAATVYDNFIRVDISKSINYKIEI